MVSTMLYSTSGSSSVQTVTVGARDYEVITRYCVVSGGCDLSTRHLVVEVDYGNETVLTAESVYTKLQ